MGHNLGQEELALTDGLEVFSPAPAPAFYFLHPQAAQPIPGYLKD